MTRTRYTTLLGAALALGFSLPATAQETDLWKNVGNWEISIDKTIGNGCYALASWVGGTVLRIGLNPQKNNFYTLIGNDAWTSLEDGKTYDIAIQFDSRPRWDVKANGLKLGSGGTVYLHAQSTKFEFIDEFMKANRLKLSYGGKEIDVLKLNGSSRAFQEVRACQKAADARVAPGTDPFATGNAAPGSGKKTTPGNDDPFAN